MYCLGWRMKRSCYDGVESGSCPSNTAFWLAAAAVALYAVAGKKGRR